MTDRLQQLQDLSERIARDVHGISRDLRSSELEDFGVQTALTSYVENWSERHGIVVDFQSTGFEDDERLAPHVETTLYRIVQEALTNVLKHAEAQRVSVILEYSGGDALAIIEDDGKGFDAEAVIKTPVAKRRLGLLGMQERVALVGGTLEIESSPGAGTTIVARIPTTEERLHE
ncbi:MAG: sensor histidine kinase [Acidobacteria bacterium]|nr:sensor histidine kinase [Acidobacteriota bacterium]